MIRQYFDWRLSFIFLFSFLFFYHPNKCFGQDSCKWDSIGTEKEYFGALHFAGSLTFQRVFEYPFLLLLNEDEKQHYFNLT